VSQVEIEVDIAGPVEGVSRSACGTIDPSFRKFTVLNIFVLQNR
jgi:hypothetical protein